MKKKYEFTETTFNDAGFIMHQIRALKDFDEQLRLDEERGYDESCTE